MTKRAFVVIALMLAAGVPARALDGTAIVNKMQTAYGALGSYSHQISTTVLLKSPAGNRTIGETAELRIKKPNRVYIQASSPATGTVVAYSDGRQLVIYRGRNNSVTRGPSPADIPHFMAGVKGIFATLLDPLHYLSGKTVNSFAAGFKAAGTTTVNGATCYVVKGTLTPAAMRPAKSGSVTFWIDRQSFLLRKLQIARLGLPVIARTTVMRKGKRVPAQVRTTGNQTITLVVQDLRANPPLSDRDFSYPIPRGTVEYKAQ